jgi:glycosyltransferase involved in cell wall biosynthesis
VLALAAALHPPLVTTFHTVLARPKALQREVLSRLAAASARVVVMTERGRELLTGVYGVPESQVAVIPHGVPDLPFGDPDGAKPALGLAGRRVILNFGLLGPGKGLELAIDALADVIEAVPTATLVIAGRTHPEVRRRHGEAYRRDLAARAAALGLSDHVRFIDRYLETDELAALLGAADVFVTPYPNAAQITSGTLAYAVAAGAAVVSTPYEHARELLADGRGVLVPFGDAAALATAFRALLTDDDARDAMRRRAWLHGRTMVWPAVGASYRTLFAAVLAQAAVARPRRHNRGRLSSQGDLGAQPPRRSDAGEPAGRAPRPGATRVPPPTRASSSRCCWDAPPPQGMTTRHGALPARRDHRNT